MGEGRRSADRKINTRILGMQENGVVWHRVIDQWQISLPGWLGEDRPIEMSSSKSPVLIFQTHEDCSKL